MTQSTNRRRLATGKRPAQPARPHLRLAAGLPRALPAPPALVDYSAMPDGWGMLGNDAAGDCVEAYVGHAVEQASFYATGTENTVTTPETIALYSTITGYDPDDPSTDQGTLMQDAFTYWRKTGVFGGHRITAFAAVTLTDWAEIENAVSMFGHVAIGFNFPDSAMDQFDAGEPWTVVPGARSDGGHCVMLVGYDDEWLYVVTWGQIQKMARAFWAAYVDEAWVVVTPETITSQGAGAFGGVVDLTELGADFAALTGEANPFPGTDPGPVPDPVPDPPAPDPVPAVTIDAADQALHDDRAIRHMLRRREVSEHDVRRAVEQWEQAKGFTS